MKPSLARAKELLVSMSHPIIENIAISVLSLFPVANACAWMEAWEPQFECTPATFRTLSKEDMGVFFSTLKDSKERPYHDSRFGLSPYDYPQFSSSEGVTLDLNGDGTDDIAVFIPWMGCGLAACGYWTHFLVSDGEGGYMENIMECYNAEPSDLVKVNGKTYFKQSNHVWHYDKSKHNYWVYQMFSFETNGLMKCADDEVGDPFPAITIHYIEPRFKQADLAPAVRKEIAEEAKPVSRKFAMPKGVSISGDRNGFENLLVRIAEIEVKPEFLDDYLAAARTVGAESIAEEPGVVCIFPMQKAENPTSIRIVEIYRGEEGYKAHLATPHFRAYKEGTAHMIESLRLVTMQPLDPAHMDCIFEKLE